MDTRVRIAVVGPGRQAVQTILGFWMANPKLVKIVSLGNASGSGNGLNGKIGGGGNRGNTSAFEFPMEGIMPFNNIHEQIAAGDFDAIWMCQHAMDRVDVLIEALEAGHTVISEKPLLVDPSQMDRLKEAMSKGRLIPLAVVEYIPQFAWLSQQIRELNLGKVISANFHRLCAPPDWSPKKFFDKDGGGALFDLMVHNAYFINRAFGTEPQETLVQSCTVPGVPGNIPGDVTMLYRFANGNSHLVDSASVVDRATWGLPAGDENPPFDHGYNVIFEKGEVRLYKDPLKGTFELAFRTSGHDQWKSPQLQNSDKNPDFEMTRAVIESVRTGAPIEALDPDRMFNVLETLFLARTHLRSVGLPS